MTYVMSFSKLTSPYFWGYLSGCVCGCAKCVCEYSYFFKTFFVFRSSADRIADSRIGFNVGRGGTDSLYTLRPKILSKGIGLPPLMIYLGRPSYTIV